MKTDIIQKSLLFDKQGNILLLRRSETDRRRPNQWDFPGGLLEDGEPLEEGVIREILEESGIHVRTVVPFFAKTETETWTNESGVIENRNDIRIYYSAHTDETDVQISHEHSEFCWVSLRAAEDILEYHRHREVIQWVLNNKIEL